MTKDTENERRVNNKNYRQIIDRYLHSTQDKEAERFKKVFAFWFFNATDRKVKDEIMDELWVLSAETSYELSDDEVDQIADQIIQLTKKEKQKRVTSLSMLMKVAAVCIPLLCVAGTWFYLANSNEKSNYTAQFEVPAGKTEEKTLADSTKIVMNAGSKLTISQTKTERLVKLAGESYFKVSKDEKRPFIVKTQELTVTVIGTEFNVEAYPGSDLTVVTLNRGKIEIQTANNRVLLAPNQQFVYSKLSNKGVVKNIEATDVAKVSSWKQGVLVLDELTLQEAMELIGRQFDRQIEVAKGTQLDNKLFGKIATDTTIEQVMKDLNSAVPGFKYQLIDNKIKISKNNL